MSLSPVVCFWMYEHFCFVFSTFSTFLLVLLFGDFYCCCELPGVVFLKMEDHKNQIHMSYVIKSYK